MPAKATTGALDGIRVLDLTRILAGPYCTLLLGDMGAEIIKIEVPGHGDDSRTYPPFVGSESAYLMNLNRNKKSLTLNLKAPEGRAVFLELVKRSDVLIENFRPGTLDNLGVGYDSLKTVNPELVYSSISGFGHTGPNKDLPGYDIIGQAMGGIMSVTGWPDGPPSRTGTAIGDILAGLCACIGILSSLIAVRNGRPGQKVDIALVDSVVSAMEAIIQIYLVEGRIPQRTGNRYEFIYPYDTFRTSDGWVVIGVGNNKLWQQFCDAIGAPHLPEGPAIQGQSRPRESTRGSETHRRSLDRKPDGPGGRRPPVRQGDSLRADLHGQGRGRRPAHRRRAPHDPGNRAPGGRRRQGSSAPRFRSRRRRRRFGHRRRFSASTARRSCGTCWAMPLTRLRRSGERRPSSPHAGTCRPRDHHRAPAAHPHQEAVRPVGARPGAARRIPPCRLRTADGAVCRRRHQDHRAGRRDVAYSRSCSSAC